MNDLAFLHSLHGGQIEALLEVDDLSQIIQREEIPPEELERTLRSLSKKSPAYDKILFESSGEITVKSLRVFYRLPFEMVALSYQKTGSLISEFLVMQTINHTHYLDTENRPPIYVRNPRFWSNNILVKRYPTNKEANNLIINFGRFFHHIELMLQADWDLESKDLRDEEGPELYKLPTAVGYRLK